MKASASALGIHFDEKLAINAIANACLSLDQQLQYRLRLDLLPNGEFQVATGILDQITGPVKIFWAKDILPMNVEMHSGDALLRHKVSARDLYDRAWQESARLGGFDALFLNEKGFVTEGGRTSIFIKPKDKNEWLTPPVSAGLLPGVMRTVLLDDPSMNAHEANLTIQDVCMADEIILTNALRGRIQAHF